MRKIIAFFCLAFFLTPFFVLADGGLFPPPDYYMYETDQRAVIFFENNLETLILSATFRGDAKNFGWVVPTPTKPEVSRSSDELFTALEELTRVEYSYPVPMGLDNALSVGRQEDKVYIVETKKIEYYDITVLTAEDSQALTKWLDKNGYQFPANAGYILNSYISNQWYFTAIKIDAAAISPSVSNQLREGHMVPLQLKFSTDKIVFPLKISSVMETNYPATGNSTAPKLYPDGSYVYPDGNYEIYPYPSPYYPQQVGVLIYVFTPENKQTLPGFTTQYAGWVKNDTIKNLAYDENGNSWISPSKDKYFLTKLTRWMSYSEMTSDLYLRNAQDNNLVNAKPLEQEEQAARKRTWFYAAMAVGVMLILGAGGGFIILGRNKINNKSKIQNTKF
ncbi:MAG: hypothetical protein A2174_03390 [Candidatus Portnoybacteria bacterium RBG_13_41_18]|uniref:DUF2330 domain-containing protein n=1 Tax=Candidatus Portnoybacteria bacterium RBG_13_41_18 TaxID=1801991 RepID=A0A1G2F4Z3_9BACT|nr:MAG: hypothetical protein A2174_03390 [Candidatus Portnoybacteria bacterium RBG_13_41_18]